MLILFAHFLILPGVNYKVIIGGYCLL